MKRKNIALIIAGVLLSGTSFAQDQQQSLAQNPAFAVPPPPTDQAGKCYALVNIPAKLGSETEQVESQSAAETLEMIPAKYKWVEKEVEIKPEEKSYEIIPATYKTIEEEVLVEPERIEYEIIPAQFEERTETVEVKPTLRVWKQSGGNSIAIANEIMRLVEEPAEHQTITKRVMIKGPEVIEKVIPAEYSTIEKVVVDQPATVKEIVVPAEYKVIRVKEIESEAQEVRTPTPAETQQITKQVLLNEAEVNWQRIPCDSDLSEENIIAIQQGLRNAGYDITADGKFGKGSMDALEQYQQSKGLATGAITIETMQSLGINID